MNGDREVVGRGLEGVVAKKAASRYSGGRSADWLKFPVRRTGEFVVVGHTWVEPRVVCEVRFLERTDDGLLRHSVFVRFLPDKGRPRVLP